jgi:cytochrome c-type biogenesis protein CcmH
MPNRRQWQSKLLIAFVAALFLAHGATPLSNDRVRALGNMLHCKCGCNASVTECNMLQCHFSDPVRMELLTMVEAGRDNDDILDAMVGKYGKDILRRPPAEGFYMLSYAMPYVGLAAGLALIGLLLRFYLRRRPAAALAAGEASPELNRYQAQIDKDLSDLDS